MRNTNESLFQNEIEEDISLSNDQDRLSVDNGNLNILGTYN